MPAPDRRSESPSTRELLLFWGKLGLISFGGPAGQISIMHRELVERRRWVDEDHFLHALNYCMLLPGPEATQLAIYIGWLIRGTWCGILAGVLFVLPSALLLWGLSWLYAAYGAMPLVAAFFYGLKPAVVAVVAASVLRIGRRVLKTPAMACLAALAWVAIAWARVPFPALVAGAAVIGLLGVRFWPAQFAVLKAHPTGEAPAVKVSLVGEWRRGARLLFTGLVVWWSPILAALAWQGAGGLLFQQGLFFSKAALVTFGGAYAVLPYVAQKAVEDFQWLGATQMLDGLGLAETTPGPLIMVLEFVGFMGGWQHAGGALPPLAMATLGAAVTVWATFVPSFIFVLLGAPYVERMRGSRRIAGALSAITAMVVGVILNLALWFGYQVFFPHGGGLDGFALGLTGLALVGLIRWNWGLIPVTLGGAMVGFLWKLLV